MQRVRFGVIGVGGMGVAHAHLLQRIEQAELIAVCSASPQRTQQVAQQFGVPGYPDYRALIDNANVDAVLIATPHPLHAEIAQYAFRRGVHVLCEKPLAVSISQGRQMVSAARQHGCLLGVMLQLRTERHFRQAKQAVDAGLVGKIVRTCAIASWCRNQIYYQSAAWRGTWGGEGGGVLMNQAPHHLDIFCWLAGNPRRVTAQTRTRYHTIEVEDEAFAWLEYPNGAHGYLYVSVNEMPFTRRFEVVGENGKLIIDGEQTTVTRTTPPLATFFQEARDMWEMPSVESIAIEVTESENGHEAVIRNFVRAVLYNEPLIAPGEEALHSLELANAMVLSAKRKRTVEFPLDEQEYDRLLNELRATSQIKPVVAETRQTDPNIAKAIQMETDGQA